MTTLQNLLASLSMPLLLAVVKSSLLILMAFCINQLLRRRSAAVRHCVWMASLAGAIFCLMFAWAVPSWNVKLIDGRMAERFAPTPSVFSNWNQAPVKDAAPAAFKLHEVKPAAKKPARKSPDQGPPKETDSASSHWTISETPAAVNSSPSRSFSWPIAAFAVWMCGALIVSSRYFTATLRVRGVIRRGIELHDARWRRCLRETRARMGISRFVTLLSSSEIDIPMTWGVRHPVIVVPPSSAEWDVERMQSVMDHELAHVKRMDALTQLYAHAAAALYWFNPLVWMALRQMRFERERACDDFVLAQGAKPSKYAADLLDIAGSATSGDRYQVALAMARPSQFEGRLVALLDDRIEHTFLTQRTTLIVACVTLAVALPLTAATIGVKDKKENKQNVTTYALNKTEHTVSAVSNVLNVLNAGNALVGRSEQVASIQDKEHREGNGYGSGSGLGSGEGHIHETDSGHEKHAKHIGMLAGCGSMNTQRSISQTEDNGTQRWIVDVENSNCSVHMKTENAKFNQDMTGVESIRNGGYVTISTKILGDSKQLDVRPGPNGLEYKFTHNGTAGPIDQQWLNQFLIELDNDTAFFVDYRLPKMLAEGGPDRVLRETDQMDSDYAHSRYMLGLLDAATLSSSQVAELLRQAGTIDSDYECARDLMAVAGKYSLDDNAIRERFIQVISSLESDYEHARVLTALLDKAKLSDTDAKTVFESVVKIHSDYELARVLSIMSDKKLITRTLLPEYLRAVDQIKSDYEHARTLKNFIEMTKGQQEFAGPVLESATKIDSDYEKSQVLMQIAERFNVNGELRQAYLRAADSIHSDYERKQVMSRLKEASL